MNVNQAASQSDALNNQVDRNWSNPAAAEGFASQSQKQIQKLYNKCIKKHPPTNPGTGSGGEGGGGGGLDPGGDATGWLACLYIAIGDDPWIFIGCWRL